MTKEWKRFLLFLLAAGILLSAPNFSGDLEPSGPPSPTMVTLQEIDDKLDSLVVTMGALPKTGQTECWDQSGTPVSCAGTGQDGESQRGVSVSPRFADNSDGTVSDNLTGLIWLKDADCFGVRVWLPALSDSNALANGSCGLSDGSSAGDWRLPNLRELQSLIDFTQTAPALPSGHPFTVVAGSYWASTSHVEFGEAWVVNFHGPVLDRRSKGSLFHVWPVRGGL